VAGGGWASAVAGGGWASAVAGDRQPASGGQVRAVALFIFLFFKYLVI
jgi:hypothetical protein